MVAFGVHKPGLIVNRHGVARVSYTTAAGLRRHVLAWGAINALTPRQGAAQVHFKFDYSGGHRVVRERLLEAYAQLLPPVHRASS